KIKEFSSLLILFVDTFLLQWIKRGLSESTLRPMKKKFVSQVLTNHSQLWLSKLLLIHSLVVWLSSVPIQVDWMPEPMFSTPGQVIESEFQEFIKCVPRSKMLSILSKPEISVQLLDLKILKPEILFLRKNILSY